jgi:hypothetical protein
MRPKEQPSGGCENRKQKGEAMIGRLRKVSYAGVLLALSFVVLAGCETATGGGFIPSQPTGADKATFGFTTHCKNTTLENGDVEAQLKGQFQYYDREADVRFHAFLPPVTEIAPPDETDACAFFDTIVEQEFGEDSFVLEYRVQGGPKEEREELGLVRIHVVDAGEPGINGDELTIEVLSGPYMGYTNTGFIEGGNIQVH